MNFGRWWWRLLFGKCLACGRWIADHSDAESQACIAAADEVLAEQRAIERRRGERSS